MLLQLKWSEQLPYKRKIVGSNPTDSTNATMMEKADVADSKAEDRNIVWVQVPLVAPKGM